MPKPWEVEFSTMVERAAHDAEKEAREMSRQGRWEDLYVYHKPGSMKATSYDLPAPWQNSGFSITCNIPYDQYARIIREAGRYLPVLTAI